MKTLVGTKSCGISAIRFWSDSSDSDPGADITCKLNRCKQSYFSASSFTLLDFVYLVGLPTDPPTGRNYLATG